MTTTELIRLVHSGILLAAGGLGLLLGSIHGAAIGGGAFLVAFGFGLVLAGLFSPATEDDS